MSFKVHSGLPILRVGPCHTRLSKGCISCCIAFWNPCFIGQHKASQTSRSKPFIEQLMTPKWYAGSYKHQQNGCPKKPTHQATHQVGKKNASPKNLEIHQHRISCISRHTKNKCFASLHFFRLSFNYFWKPPLLASWLYQLQHLSLFACLGAGAFSWYLRRFAWRSQLAEVGKVGWCIFMA